MVERRISIGKLGPIGFERKNVHACNPREAISILMMAVAGYFVLDIPFVLNAVTVGKKPRIFRRK